MNKNIPKLCWCKWKDPYNITDDDEYDNKGLKDGIYEDEYDNNISQPMKAIITPMGILPIPEYATPQKVFNMWMAHTNFNITADVLKAVENTDGVETVDIFTRYRMRVGIGKMFDTKTTINNINTNVSKCVPILTSGNIISC